MRGSLLRVLDRDRQRFQLHALLRDQLRARAGEDGLAELQERHAAALEKLVQGLGDALARLPRVSGGNHSGRRLLCEHAARSDRELADSALADSLGESADW